MGMEMVAGHMVDAHGYSERSLPMELEYLVEESMEMLGAIYFLTALLRHVELRGAPLVFVVSMPDARVRSPCAGESDIPS
jgi:hypothetical protein